MTSLVLFLSACGLWAVFSPKGEEADTALEGDTDTNTDADVDADTDSDTDTDTNTDTDSDTGEMNCDRDGDGFWREECGGTDCDDLNPHVYPGATEVCNSVDDDCDGEIDEHLSGLSLECPATSCLEILNDGRRVSGDYYLQELSGTVAVYYCDMSFDGGGWTQVLSWSLADGGTAYTFEREWDYYGVTRVTSSVTTVSNGVYALWFAGSGTGVQISSAGLLELEKGILIAGNELVAYFYAGSGGVQHYAIWTEASDTTTTVLSCYNGIPTSAEASWGATIYPYFGLTSFCDPYDTTWLHMLGTSQLQSFTLTYSGAQPKFVRFAARLGLSSYDFYGVAFNEINILVR